METLFAPAPKLIIVQHVGTTCGYVVYTHTSPLIMYFFTNIHVPHPEVVKLLYTLIIQSVLVYQQSSFCLSDRHFLLLFCCFCTSHASWYCCSIEKI